MNILQYLNVMRMLNMGTKHYRISFTTKDYDIIQKL